MCRFEGDDSKEARSTLFCWGYGGHGNLGLGDRNDRIQPVAVTGQVCMHMCRLNRRLCVLTLVLRETAISKGRAELQPLPAPGVKKGSKVFVHCPFSHFSSLTGAFIFSLSYLWNVSGGLRPKEGGTEGPHTLCVASSGAVYSFGTDHISQYRLL